MIAGHFAMVGLAPAMRLNPAMWSLVYEMRISLVFPLLVLLCRDSRMAVAAGLVLLLAPIKILNLAGGGVHPSFATTPWQTAVWSLQLSAYFVTGILLAKHVAALRSAWAKLPMSLRPALALLPVLAFCCRPALNSGKTVLLYDLGAAALEHSRIESSRGILVRPDI